MTNKIDPFEVIRPCWLIANGDHERVEVLRSPLVSETHRMHSPVSEHIAAHGLVLAARETYPSPEFMHGEVEMSVYVTPEVRNAGYAVAGAA